MANAEESELARAASKAGITTSEDGSRHIPASVRADGSMRKEIKVRPGYLPPEDVERWKNPTAESFRNRARGGVLGAELVDAARPKEQSASASKNAKRREARKKAAADRKDEDPGVESEARDVNGKADTLAEVDTEITRQKEVRKLVKKLRQAKDLKDKKESGAALLPEQFEKVVKINELIRRLESLGVDADGEDKDAVKVTGKAPEP